MTNQTQNPKSKTFSTIGDVLKGVKNKDDAKGLSAEYTRDKYISREFQKYAYDLAKELGDLSHKSLYMRLAKNTPRALLENAKSYVKDANNVQSKGRLFMWYLKKLKVETQERKDQKLKSKT